MKRIFFICGIAISALGISTIAGANQQQHISNYYSVNDTIPKKMHNKKSSDSMHKDWNNNNNNNMHNMDSSMNDSRDSSTTAPPRQ